MRCTQCARPIRSGQQKAEDHPGTVQGWKGKCGTCHRGRGVTRRRTAPGTPCVGCDRPLRPNSTSITDHPGTIVHHAHGRCTTCHHRGDGSGKSERARQYDRIPITIAGHDDPAVRHLAEKAQEMLDDRRRRGIPPEGTMPELTDA